MSLGLTALSVCMIAWVAEAQEATPRSEAEKKAIAKIRQLGGHALELAQNDPRLEVSYQQLDSKITDEHLALLKELKGLVHLNLRGQPVTDDQLANLKDLTSLTELHLEKTKITDKGLAHLKGLVNLEYLNLYETAVTDAGLANLEGMKKLKNLYVWQTKVTEAGAAKLKKAIPTVDLNRGTDLEKLIAEKKEETKKADDKAPKAEKKDEPKKGDDKKPNKEEKKKPEENKPEEKKK
jgi:hypothetical protein